MSFILFLELLSVKRTLFFLPAEDELRLAERCNIKQPIATKCLGTFAGVSECKTSVVYVPCSQAVTSLCIETFSMCRFCSVFLTFEPCGGLIKTTFVH